MHFTTAIAAATAALTPLASAHDAPGLPNIVGLNLGNIKDLKARSLLSKFNARAVAASEAQPKHEKRQNGNTDGQCGGSFGSCAAGYCCSGAGWCGNTADYCYSPGCQYQYGPGCSENKTPAGGSTANIARPKLGSVPYGGAGIYSCQNPGTVAITYDDGPFQGYTDHVLDLFKQYDAGKATFFITGANINKGQIDTTPEHIATIKRMYSEGHQIASHTWTHLDLSAISAEDRKQQMWKNEAALRNIIGKFPTYMRPPFSSCTAESGCEKDMADLGYHVTYFDVDTDDYNQNTADRIQNSVNWFKGNITKDGATSANSDWLAIAHDIHYTTAYTLTEEMLKALKAGGYKAVTVGECLGDPVTNWYRDSASGGTPSSTSSGPTSTPTKKVSTDATCGGNTGFTCQGSTFGNCCSANGWCGSTSDYCGTGCQPGAGTCNGSPSSSATPTRSSTPTPSSTLKVSTDGTCAGNTGFTCRGSTFGNCCSQYGWCGSSTGHCGTGCNNAFGTCT